jgi:glucan phosphoethanolaminetransferase (alkaline phosphatase superfamily)
MKTELLKTCTSFLRKHDVLFSVAIVVFLDLLFLRGWQKFWELAPGVRFWVNFAFSVWVFFAGLVVLRWLAARGVAWRILASVVLAGGLVLQDSHFYVYREYISSFGILFFFENPRLIFEGTGDLVPFWRSVVLILLVAPLPFFWKTRFEPRRPWRRWLGAGGMALAGLVVMPFLAFFWYSNATYQVAPVAFASAVVETGRTLHFGSVKFQKPKVPAVATAQKPPNIVWIVGESLSAANIGALGYKRDTTPHLSRMVAQHEVVAFSNVVSIGVHTMISVPYLLTGLQGSDPDGAIYKTPTIFDYATARGYDTHFLSAQDTRWGSLSQFIGNSGVAHFYSGTHFNPNVSVHKGADDMLVLEKGVKPMLAKTATPFFLMVQMDGSHYPYAEHSPPEFKKFLPEGDANSLNAYDNTVHYSDHYFNELVKAVRARDPNAWIFFVSDHGDSINEHEGRFHYRFGRNIIHVPLFVWHPDDGYERLRKNEHRPISQADILPTILELMGMEPAAPIDGLSLFGEIPESRLRVVSKYMATLQPHPSAAVVYPDFSFLEADYTRRSVTLTDRKTVVPLEQAPPQERALLERRVF